MKKFFCITVVFIFFYACKKQSGDGSNSSGDVDCSGPAKSFITDVNPIIQAFCSASPGCHGNGSSNGPGPLVNYAQLFNSRASVRSAVASGAMPFNRSLSTSQKNAILCWIDNGAPNN